MKLLLTGVNHKTAPVELRERLAFPELAIAPALARLRGGAGISEALILSTCNRVEITVSTEDDFDARRAVEAVMRGSVEGNQMYRYEGREAIEHLFRVAASLDAMVVGEPQILGQMKSAYALAKSEGAMHGLLERVMSRAFSVAKRVRSETGIGQMAVSVSYAAVELARKIFGNLHNKTVMLVGSGKMSELAARHLRRSGASRIFVTNRTSARAEEMARVFQGTAVDYGRFVEMLPDVDIVITSSAAPHYVLGREEMQRVIAARKNKPMFVIDIAVPRNVEPQVNEIDNVFLYDIDDLQGVVNTNLAERQKEVVRAESIVSEEVERMLARLKVQEVAPVIVSLQTQFEQIRSAEVAKAMRKAGALDEDQVETLTRAIVAKIAHGPISELRRQAGEPEGGTVVETIRRVFGL
ncbi:MAG: glutamyl-tRNA reductase [Acidobacteriota bacterium]|nr:glutamyl-tRNA reductase [Acidobacteriota bacterium]